MIEGIDPRVAAALEILNRNRATDTCSCELCKAGIEVAGEQTCPTCGFVGHFVAADCTCFDRTCPGKHAIGNHDSRGAGCFHGGLFCPVCDGEDIDAFALLRDVRAALTEIYVYQVD